MGLSPSESTTQKKKPVEKIKTMSTATKTSTTFEDAKSIAEKKRKEKQAIEQAKIDAIEAKIEIARKRIEEKKTQRSSHAKSTI